jgi:hypothetical protein
MGNDLLHTQKCAMINAPHAARSGVWYRWREASAVQANVFQRGDHF